MGCCLAFLSQIRPSAVTPRDRTDSWTSEHERSAWAAYGQMQAEEEERQLEREWQELDAQEFLAREQQLAF